MNCNGNGRLPMAESDSLWIDFSRASSEMEYVARFTSQLYLRNAIFKDEIVKSVRGRSINTVITNPLD